jgi:hypothetical protein
MDLTSQGNGLVCCGLSRVLLDPQSYRKSSTLHSSGKRKHIDPQFPRMLRALTPQGAFGAYAAFNVIALVLIWFFVPETKLLTLEELDGVFSVPTGVYGKYQTGTVLPHFIRRVLFRRKNEPLPPLIHDDPKRRNYA